MMLLSKIDPDGLDALAYRAILPKPWSLDSEEGSVLGDVHAGPRDLNARDLALV